MNPMSPEEVLAEIRAVIDRVGSQREFARQVGVAHAYVYRVLAGKNPPSQRILSACGIERVYIRLKQTK